MSTELAPTFDRDAILRHLKLNQNDPATQALFLVCDRYHLDPLLKHMVIIQGNPYVTRDGYLHIAHLSGQLAGIEVIDTGDDSSHWWAKVSVYRKDMQRPFTFTGRYPKDGQNKKFGPEMALKCAEVMALRRAFDVTGVGAAEERWDVNRGETDVEALLLDTLTGGFAQDIEDEMTTEGGAPSDPALPSPRPLSRDDSTITESHNQMYECGSIRAKDNLVCELQSGHVGAHRMGTVGWTDRQAKQ